MGPDKKVEKFGLLWRLGFCLGGVALGAASSLDNDPAQAPAPSAQTVIPTAVPPVPQSQTTVAGSTPSAAILLIAPPPSATPIVPPLGDLRQKIREDGRHWQEKFDEDRRAFESRERQERRALDEAIADKAIGERRRLIQEFRDAQAKRRREFEAEQEKRRRLYDWRYPK